ncbi:MAG: GcrA family cell cycle regulator [Acidiphilium sp.]|nr:GcrA family cell cycle regulator [Acidiphilium sp.]MDD4936263.1 GcrA family cell cycle regulator [Acidiphilium sp.]
MEWTDDIIIRLRSLWDEGLSTAEIGRRLSISKNAVVGKAHRLDLPARPSPIRRDPAAIGTLRDVAPRRVSGPTLPSLATPAAEPAIVPQIVPQVVARAPVPAAKPLRPSLIAAMAAPVRLAPRTPSCCWPIGEPGTPAFHFCGDPALANKPYCGPHAEIAYVRVRDRREDVA